VISWLGKRRLLVQLRDGRKIIGILRSFDQFANLVLENAVERIIVGRQFGESPLGLYVVRGENVVLLGEINDQADPPATLQKVPEADIKRAQKAEREQEKIKKSMAKRMDFLEFGE
jgi:U6 snRNA-associated Sm-like protein LSm1